MLVNRHVTVTGLVGGGFIYRPEHYARVTTELPPDGLRTEVDRYANTAWRNYLAAAARFDVECRISQRVFVVPRLRVNSVPVIHRRQRLGAARSRGTTRDWRALGFLRHEGGRSRQNSPTDPRPRTSEDKDEEESMLKYALAVGLCRRRRCIDQLAGVRMPWRRAARPNRRSVRSGSETAKTRYQAQNQRYGRIADLGIRALA